MEHLPYYVYLVFGLTTALTLFKLFKAGGKNKNILFIVLVWLGAQSALAIAGFYKVMDTLPPRFALLTLPPLLFIIFLATTNKGKSLTAGFDRGALTLMHVIRIPVEMGLFMLCSFKRIPELITFEGVNFDIFSGITAPVVYYFGYVKKTMSRGLLIAWNLVCLGLLINVVVHAILALPAPFQQFAFDQPNRAVILFPFIWLPCFIVMAVLFSHLVCLRSLVNRRTEEHGILNAEVRAR